MSACIFIFSQPIGIWIKWVNICSFLTSINRIRIDLVGSKGSDFSWMVFIGIWFHQCYLVLKTQKTIVMVKKTTNYTKNINMSICRSESAVGFPKSPQNYIKTKKIWSILKFNFGIEHGINSNKNVLTSQIW